MDLTAYLASVDESGIIVDREPTGNIEAQIKNNILVLENLKSKEYPSYMITIINDDTFQCGNNLTSTLELLANYQKNGFVMSTSSYNDELTGDAHNPFYHATALKESDFKNTPADAVAAGGAVVVYVERLAAKVQVKLGDELKGTEVTPEEGDPFTIYELSETVAGGEEGDNKENETDVLDTKLYIHVLGWTLNTTANQSYMSKNIDTNWNFTWQDASWNNADHFRSYWAKAYTYGDDADAIARKVTYRPTEDFTNADLTNEVGTTDVAYCNENTNIPGNIYSVQEGSGRLLVDSRVATNVVLRTQIVDAKGKPIDMVYANGVLFRKNAYLQYILNRAYTGTDALNIWTMTSKDDVNTYNQIDKTYFELVYPTAEGDYEGLGDVNVNFKRSDFETFAATTALYKKVTTDGKTEFVEINKDTELSSILDGIQTRLDAVQPTGENHAVIYDNGNNIYYIPIEHLAAKDGLTADEVAAGVEGYFGVVRNHFYVLQLNSFSKVGHGMWEPGKYEEATKPEKPEDPLYYLGAHINILSWKVVNQDVDL